MPITFQCSGCGKDYAVSDGLAGKRAACKACGQRMTIPVVTTIPVVLARPSSPPPARAIPAARPVERPTTRPRRDPIPEVIPVAYPVAKVKPARAYEPEPPAEDIYGLNEAPSPLPPLMPPRGEPGANIGVDPPVKKKRKKRGFFSSGGSKRPSGGAYSRGEGLSGIRLIAGIVGAICGLGGVGGWFMTSKASMETYCEKLISLANDASATLSNIRDQGGAAAASTKVNGQLRAINDVLETMKDKKGRMSDINDIEQHYSQRILAAYSSLGTQLRRVFSIPGGQPALAVDGEFQRMLGLFNDAEQAARKNKGLAF